jgi:hypothetical protein
VPLFVAFHYAAQLMLPVPAVIVVTLNPPEGDGVFAVSPAPMVIVYISGYENMITPDAPALASKNDPPLAPPPPPPLPVLIVADVAATDSVPPEPPPPVPPEETELLP